MNQMVVLDRGTLPSVPAALKALDRLEVEIGNAPTFEKLDHAANLAAGLQRSFRTVKKVADRAGEVWGVGAERKLGEEWAKARKAKGGQAYQKKPTGAKSEPVGIPPTLKELGIDRKRAMKARRLASIANTVQQRYISQLKSEGRGVSPSAILLLHYHATRQRILDKRKATLFSAATGIPAGLYVGDFRKLSPRHIANDSVELVLIDPPYDTGSIPLYGAAAQEAARILKPGGSLITYAGQPFLPKIIDLMCKHLNYYWICACVYKTGHAQMRKRGIVVKFKPILWFVKGRRGDVQTFLSDVLFCVREKDIHEWQQPQSDAEYFIRQLSSQNGLVVDFFVGSGTTLVAAKQLGRKWIGFEIDKETAKLAANRLNITRSPHRRR